MPELHIDDIHPYIYSEGMWYQERDYGGAANRTRSLTRSSGAYKLIHFIGTSITVHGGLQPLEDGGKKPANLRITFSIDGGPQTEYAPQITGNRYYNATYYQSQTLDINAHVLLIRNMVEMDLCWLDRFVITAPSGGRPPELLRSYGSFTPSPILDIPASTAASVIAPTTTNNSSFTSTTQSSRATNPLTSEISSRETPAAGFQNPSTELSDFQKLTTTSDLSTGIVSQDIPVPTTTYQTTIINAQNDHEADLPSNRNFIIISTACGGFAALLSLVIIIGYTCKRCKHRQRTVTSNLLTPKPQHSTSTPPMRTSIRRSPNLGGVLEQSSGQHMNSSTVLVSTILESDMYPTPSEPESRGVINISHETAPRSSRLPPYAI